LKRPRKEKNHEIEGKNPQRPDLFPTGRMLSFSDRLMAFAATLLIVGIHIPAASDLAGPGGLLRMIFDALQDMDLNNP
jgi:hypothetical protein